MVLPSPGRWVRCQLRQTLAASVFWPMHQCKHFDRTLLAKSIEASLVFFFLNLPWGCPSVFAHLVTFGIMTLGYRSCVDTWKQKAKKQCGIGVSHHLQWSMSLCQTETMSCMLRPDMKIASCYFLSFPLRVGWLLNAIGYTGSWLSHATSLLKTCIFHISIYFDLALWNWHRDTQGTIWSPGPWPCRINESPRLQAAYSGPTSDTRVASAARFHRGPLFSPHLARSFFSCCWMACLNATASGLETWVFLA